MDNLTQVIEKDNCHLFLKMCITPQR